MSAQERRRAILETLIEHGIVEVETLVTRFGISRMTVHRDFDALVSEGWAKKIRGGITVVSDTRFESDFQFRKHINIEEKQRLAAAAADLVEDGDAVGLGFGTTVAGMIEALRGLSDLTIATASLPCIDALTDRRDVELIAVGGRYIPRFDGFFGRLAEKGFAELMLDACFLSSSALSFPTVYHQDEHVVQLKLAIMSAARRKYLLMDHTKIGRTALHRLGRIDLFDAIITDREVSPENLAIAEDLGTRIIVA